MSRIVREFGSVKEWCRGLMHGGKVMGRVAGGGGLR